MPNDSAVLDPDQGIRHLPAPRRNPHYRGPLFPIVPLFGAIGQEYLAGSTIAGSPIPRLASRLNVDRNQIYRWLGRGLDQWQADSAAIALGLHPSNVWSNWFSTVSEDDFEIEGTGV
jgi:hypothetical protein